MALEDPSNLISNGSGTLSIQTDPRSRGAITIQALSMCLILLSGFVGNTLILVAIYIDKTLQTVTNAFLVNLACADLLLSVTGMPFTLVSSITYDWIFGPVWCDINGMANSLFCVASMLTLAAVSIDRYIAIIHPLRYTSYMTNRTAAAMIIYIWLHSLSIALLPVMGWSQYTFLRKEFICTVYWELDISCTIFIFVVCFFFPFTIMIFTYSRVLRTAWKQSKRIVPITGRFSERRKEPERLDSSTCEPVSVGSMDSANRLSLTGSTNVHTSLSTEEHFTFPSENFLTEEALDNDCRISKDRMNILNADTQVTKTYEQLGTKEQGGYVNKKVHGLDRSTVGSDDTGIIEFKSNNSDNVDTSKKENNSLERNKSSMSFNLNTKAKLIAKDQQTINNGLRNSALHPVEPNEARTLGEHEVHKTDRIPNAEGVYSGGIVHNNTNYSQIKPSSQQSKVKREILMDDPVYPLSDSYSQCSQDLSDEVFLPLASKTSNNISSLDNNNLPPLRSAIKKVCRGDQFSTTSTLQIDHDVSPSHSLHASPKRRRVTVASCHRNSEMAKESVTQNNYTKTPPHNGEDTMTTTISSSSPCLQRKVSKTSLRVANTAAKRKISGFRMPSTNIQALRKRSMNPNVLLKMKQETKAVRTLLIVVGTFVICWLPHFIGIFCILTKKCTWPDSYFAITTWLAMLNSGCNPVIYGAMSRQFRKRFRQILQCKRGFF